MTYIKKEPGTWGDWIVDCIVAFIFMGIMIIALEGTGLLIGLAIAGVVAWETRRLREK